MSHPILIEGYTSDQILALPDDLISSSVLTGVPMVFRVGTADILGTLRVKDDCLVVELAQIDGGGEGVLPALWSLANKYAAKHDLSHVEWIVHAINCAKPNPKLRLLLERRSFVVEEVEGVGLAYHLIHSLSA